MHNAEKYKGKYRIKSARLQGWDYSKNGAYFVTICTKDKEYFFGKIKNEKVNLSEMGEIAKKYWKEISQHFPFIILDEYCVMPNHVHGILWIKNAKNYRDDRNLASRDAINRVSTGGITGKHNPMGQKTLSEIIRWYKGRSSFEIRKKFKFFAWQSRFHDHIIRNEERLNLIRNYIIHNHLKWKDDRYCVL